MYRQIDLSKSCPKCELSMYGWDGVHRHLERGWCKALDNRKVPEKEASAIIGAAIQQYLQGKEEEYLQDEEYDRAHNLGAYSY